MNKFRIIGFLFLIIGIGGHFLDHPSYLGFWFGVMGGIGGGLLLIGKTNKAS